MPPLSGRSPGRSVVTLSSDKDEPLPTSHDDADSRERARPLAGTDWKADGEQSIRVH